MRDAIVLSGFMWEAFNVPERLALAFSRAGSRVLYCENPVSIFRHQARALTEVEKGIFAFGLQFIGHRLNNVSICRGFQAKLLTNQILEAASKLGLTSPVLVYPHGDYPLAVCREFKQRGFRLIHVSMDYEPPLITAHASESDTTLCIPRATYNAFRELFGDKVNFLPQLSSWGLVKGGDSKAVPGPHIIEALPRPRLAYLGSMAGRVSRTAISSILAGHPEWQFISFGGPSESSLPNERVLPWKPRNEVAAILGEIDVGFMPYDCSDPKNLNCVPLKLFDYFAKGLPVVSSPILCVREFEDLVYVGSTPAELTAAIKEALDEPLNSPKRAQRQAIAQAHSVDNISQILAPLLENQKAQTSSTNRGLS